MTTKYFAELTDHTIQEAETLLIWAGIEKWAEGEYHEVHNQWRYQHAFYLWLWLHEQTILAIRDGGGIVNESLSH